MIFPRELSPVIVAEYIPGVEEFRAQLVTTVLFDVRAIDDEGQVIESPLEEMNDGETVTESSKLILFRVTGMIDPEAPELKLIDGLTVEIL